MGLWPDRRPSGKHGRLHQLATCRALGRTRPPGGEDRMKHRHLEVFAVLSTPCLVVWALYLSASGCDFVGVFAALVGYVIADFFCGAIHWYCDERANESWKWIGPSFIRPFRDH